MVAISGFRSYRRVHNGILFPLKEGEWPLDTPLLGDAVIINFEPYCRLTLDPDLTTELISGWFKVSIQAEVVISFYQDEMSKMGWVIENKGYIYRNSAEMFFEMSKIEARSRISIHATADFQETSILIQRVVISPWLPDARDALNEDTTNV